MGHGHAHPHPHLTGRKLGIACLLSFGVLAALAIGGWLANSLALMADAGHVLTDIAALGLSWVAVRQAARPADASRTFGFHRSGILAALANASTLVAIAVVIVLQATQRLFAPPVVETQIMVATAAVGLVFNLGLGKWLHADSAHSLNVRSAYLHVLGDAAASAGVIVGAVAIRYTGLSIIDPLLSIAIALLIAVGAWQVIDESLHILMEGTPRGLDLAALVTELGAVSGVREVHDLHVWSLAEGVTSLSCHVLIDDQHVSQSMAVLAACNHLLAHHYGISHTTLQLEAEHCSPDSPTCNLAFVQPAGPDHPHHH